MEPLPCVTPAHAGLSKAVGMVARLPDSRTARDLVKCGCMRPKPVHVRCQNLTRKKNTTSLLQAELKLLRTCVTVSHMYLCNCFLHSGNCFPHLVPSVPWLCPSVPWFRHLLPRGVAAGPLLPRRLAPSPEGACCARAAGPSVPRGASLRLWLSTGVAGRRHSRSASNRMRLVSG